MIEENIEKLQKRIGYLERYILCIHDFCELEIKTDDGYFSKGLKYIYCKNCGMIFDHKNPKKLLSIEAILNDIYSWKYFNSHNKTLDSQINILKELE